MRAEDVRRTAFSMPRHSPSYPPGPYRERYLRSRPAAPARVTLSPAQTAVLAAELAPLFARAAEQLVKARRQAVYYWEH